MTNLTPHFTLESMYRSDKATALKINNKPNATETEHLRKLCVELLEPLRMSIGKPIIVNSGYRGPKTNAAVGGAKTSAHLYGYAADLVCPSYGNAKEFAKYIENWLKTNNIAFDQLIYEYDSWAHLAVCRGNGSQRRQVITINKKGTFNGIV